MSTSIKKTVFISYSHKDRDRVSLFASLLTRNSYDVWIDWNDLTLGASFISEITTSLASADIFLVFISHNSVASSWVEHEINFAITKNIEFKKPRIIPVLLDDCAIPQLLLNLQYLDARSSIRFALEQLNAALSSDKTSNDTISLSMKPIMTAATFGLSKKTEISLGGLSTEFTERDLASNRENIQKTLRKKANGILLNFVPLSDFDLQSPIPKYKNGMYLETVDVEQGDLEASICERITIQATIFNPDAKKLSDLVHNKLDKLSATSLTYVYSIPFQENNFDKRCMQKIQDNYPIISYDFEDGATIEFGSNFFLSVKCSLEQIHVKLYTQYDFSFSKKAASFSSDEFIHWLVC